MNGHTATGTVGPKRGMAEMLKGGVIIDVLTAEAMKWHLDVPRAGAATVDRADTSARAMH